MRKAQSLCVILAVLFAALAVLCFGYETVLSMKAYKPISGLAGSPWTGLANYTNLVQSKPFSALLRNSVLLKAAELMPALFLGGALAALMAALPGKLGLGLTAACLLPALTPDVLWGAMARGMEYPAALLLQTIVQGTALVAFAGGMFARAGKGGWKAALTGAAFAGTLLLMFALSPSESAIQLTQTPMNYTRSDTLGTYAYRQGLMNMNYGLGAAAGTLVAIVQIAVAAPLAMKLRCLSPGETLPARQDTRGGWIWALAACGAMLIALCAVLGRNGLLPGRTAFLLPGLSAALCAGGLGALLAIALGGLPRGARNGLAAVLIAFGGCLTGRYFFMRQQELINTVWPVALFGAIQPRVVVLATILATTANRKGAPWTILATGLCAAAFAWGEYYLSTIFTTTLNSAGALARQATLAAGEANAAALLAAVLPSAFLATLGAVAAAKAAE